jgi:hypothetical protein
MIGQNTLAMLRERCVRQPPGPLESGHRTRAVQYPSADRCLALQIAAAFSMQRAQVGQRRNRIDTMALIVPIELHQRRVRLAREPAAAAEARRQVCAAIRAWQIPVDPDIAILLTSDLVTSAIMHGDGDTVTLAVRCGCGHLRIDVHDTSGSLPMAADEPAVTQTGHGLVLVATLSTGWGSFRTDAGQVTYFTLAFQPHS